MNAFRQVLINTESITLHFPSNCRKSLTYGQSATFKVNTEKSPIRFIQWFLNMSSFLALSVLWSGSGTPESPVFCF